MTITLTSRYFKSSSFALPDTNMLIDLKDRAVTGYTSPGSACVNRPPVIPQVPMDRGVKVAALHPSSCAAVSAGGEGNSFDSIYEKGIWGGKISEIDNFYGDGQWPPKERNSASGPGSKIGHATSTSLRILKETIQKYNISTMIDMPCGDVNWIFDSRATDSLQLYLGLDIAEKVIAMNQIRFAHHSNKMFRHWDGVSCPLPKYQLSHDSTTSLAPFELVHSRDVVQHLPLAAGLQFFCTIFQSGAKVLVTTTFIGLTNRNIDIGRFYLNNLSRDPFNFPEDGVTCELTHPQHEGDSTCVYDLTQPWVQEYIRKNNCTANSSSEVRTKP
jgi:hypothetical protein